MQPQQLRWDEAMLSLEKHPFGVSSIHFLHLPQEVSHARRSVDKLPLLELLDCSLMLLSSQTLLVCHGHVALDFRCLACQCHDVLAMGTRLIETGSAP